MNRILLILFQVFILSYSVLSQTTYVNNGQNINYNLANGDSLYIASGTYTGRITSWVAGSKITVAANATFRPASYSNHHAQIINYGTIVLNSISTATGFRLTNYGIITITSDFGFNTTGQLINQGMINIGGNVNVNTGSVTNNGGLYVNGNVVVNNGSSITNTCTIVAQRGVTLNSGVITNNGFMWLPSNQNPSLTINGGHLVLSGNSLIKSVGFTNYGTVTGNGRLYLTGTTTGGGQIGAAGYTTDTIKVFVNNKPDNRLFHSQWGTVYANTTYKEMSAPDTTDAYYAPCLVPAEDSKIVLPVKFEPVKLQVSNGFTTISWSAVFNVAGTVFEVEAKTDNDGFKVLDKQNAMFNSSNYTFSYNSGNESGNVFYRVKATEPDGKVYYSNGANYRYEIKNEANVNAAPNPFSQYFTLQLQNINHSDKATIQIFNGNGKLFLTQQFHLGRGNNQLQVTTNSLPAGMYFVQVVSIKNEISTSVRMIKL